MTTERDDRKCDACLYTGVGTCAGLSGYFLLLATEGDDDGGRRATRGAEKRHVSTSFEASLRRFLRTGRPAPPRHRPFLFAFSAAWAAAGAYRLYLG